MDKAMKAALASLALVALAGCATTDKTAYRPAQTAPVAQVSSGPQVDEEYVAIVETLARQHGTQVMWVNKPVRRARADMATAH